MPVHLTRYTKGIDTKGILVYAINVAARYTINITVYNGIYIYIYIIVLMTALREIVVFIRSREG